MTNHEVPNLLTDHVIPGDDTDAPSAATTTNQKRSDSALLAYELPHDPAHPTHENATRYLIALQALYLHHDVDDRYERVTATATHVNGLGEQIEFGPWSMTTRETRKLAEALLHLAATVDACTSRQEPHD